MIKKVLFTSLVLFVLVSFQSICMSAESDDAVDKLIADYNKNLNLASTLVNTASDYAWNRKYDGAERLYRAVIDQRAEYNLHKQFA